MVLGHNNSLLRQWDCSTFMICYQTILSSDIKTVEGMPDDPERIKDTLNSLLRKVSLIT